MARSTKIKPLNASASAKIGVSYYVSGFQDYLGARILLNSGLLLQGATLASTAVEKYLKAYLAAQELRAFGHLNNWPDTLFDKLNTELLLNRDFLKLLQIVYELRYLEELNKSVSFAIERLKFTAELDRTISIINTSMQYFRGTEVINPYEASRVAKRMELISDNYLLLGLSRSEFLNRPDLAEAFYFDGSLEVMSCHLTGWVYHDETNFTAPGVSFNGSMYECLLRHREIS